MLKNIPGTALEWNDALSKNAFAVLSPVLSVTKGLTLAQLKELTGLEGSTIQNWVKRGWVERPSGKRYGERQIVRIILINMLRSSMQLEKIIALMRYINGEVDDRSDEWYDKLWNNTVDFFRSLDIPVRTLECCSGDLADLKVKSLDVEAWSPRQKKYFEVGSCSNLGDAQARRLGIRIKGKDGNYFAHTLNNTVVAPPRMLIAYLENNLNEDGTVRIPEPLRMYMGGKSLIEKKK